MMSCDPVWSPGPNMGRSVPVDVYGGCMEGPRDGKQNKELWERIEVMERLWGRFFPWIFGLRHFD